jgi:hypothetical protein
MSAQGSSRVVFSIRSFLVAALTFLAVTPSSFAAPGDRAPDGLWEEVDRAALGTVPTTPPLPTAFRAYRLLDFGALRAVLGRAPMEGGSSSAVTPPALLTLPRPDGTFARIAVQQSSIGQLMVLKPPSTDPQPAPDVMTFVFRGVDDPSISGRMTLTPTEIQAIMRPPSDLARVTPLETSTGLFYLSFLNEDRTDGANALLHLDPREGGPMEDVGTPRSCCSPVRWPLALPCSDCRGSRSAGRAANTVSPRRRAASTTWRAGTTTPTW